MGWWVGDNPIARTHEPTNPLTIRMHAPLSATQTLPIIHAVTSDEIVLRDDFIDVACAVMAALGPRGALHLRAGRISAARLQTLAGGLEAAQAITGAWLVVNDRVDLALGARARGAQLTSRSLRVADARRAAPALPLGASVHSLDEARDAASEGASWLVAGHVFATSTHPGEDGRGLTFLRAVAAAVTIPVVAIGGVRPEHCHVLRTAGAYGVAAIRGIWDAPNAEHAASDYLSAYDDAAGT